MGKSPEPHWSPDSSKVQSAAPAAMKKVRRSCRKNPFKVPLRVLGLGFRVLGLGFRV